METMGKCNQLLSFISATPVIILEVCFITTADETKFAAIPNIYQRVNEVNTCMI